MGTKHSVSHGGRKPGALDRQARALIGNELAGNILTVFRAMGGTMAMLKWAEANKTVFYTQILSRLMPQPLKEDPDITVNQLSVGNLSDIEAACRIAFALEKGLRAKRLEQPVAVQEKPADEPDS